MLLYATVHGMIRILILKLWPVLVPLTLYYAWKKYINYRLKQGEEVSLHVQRKAWLFTCICTLATLIICFIAWGLMQPIEETSGRYVPAHIKDGQIVPAHVVKE